MKIIVVSLLYFLSQVVISGDIEREKRVASQILDAILDGEPVYLNNGSHQFLTIFTQPEENSKQEAVIILHGRGLHPDEDYVANPLRTGLAEMGWTTLSVQMPILPMDAEFKDYAPILTESAPRIEKSITFLKQQGFKKVHLVAHSCSGQMTMAWLENDGKQEFDSIILISMGTENYTEYFGRTPPLNKIKKPALDIYGGDDFIAPYASKRFNLIKAGGNPKSRQIMIPDADHMFDKHQSILVYSIARWLDTL